MDFPLSPWNRRSLCFAAREILAQGRDPIDGRNRQRQLDALAASSAVIFQHAATECLQRRKAAWRNAKHAQQWENTLHQYAFPILGKMDVRDIKTEHVIRVLDPIWMGKYYIKLHASRTD